MKIAIVALLALHGLIHALGFVGTWGLAELQGASRTPTNLITAQPGDVIVRVLGVVWLAALLAFLTAAALLVADNAAWRPVALAAAIAAPMLDGVAA